MAKHQELPLLLEARLALESAHGFTVSLLLQGEPHTVTEPELGAGFWKPSSNGLWCVTQFLPSAELLCTGRPRSSSLAPHKHQHL